MSSVVWLLVEWSDSRDLFPSYRVVSVDPMSYGESDLRIGKTIMIRPKHENIPRRVQIMKVSDSKQYLKEHKTMLERQNHQFKTVMSMCMRTIKDMKSEPIYHEQGQNQHHPSPSPTHPLVVAMDSSSDSDEENYHTNRHGHHSKSASKYPPQYKRQESSILQNTLMNNHQRRRSMVSSTPLPQHYQDNVKLTFDQATQTDDLLFDSQANMAAVNEKLQHLYKQFASLINNIENNDSMSLDESGMEDSDPTLRNGEESVNDNADRNIVDRDRSINGSGAEQNRTVNVKAEESDNTAAKPLRVRRVSAQTTNNVEANNSRCDETVPIGNGNARVPARLMNEIDWTSYTSATRQLLQAIFPRRILATHSLTGKQSPAFLDKPPKKCLDPKLVDDIVITVSQRCGVPKRLVRNSITIKCTDESKLYRNRMQFRKERLGLNSNRESAVRSSPTTDDSSTVTS